MWIVGRRFDAAFILLDIVACGFYGNATKAELSRSHGRPWASAGLTPGKAAGAMTPLVTLGKVPPMLVT